MDDDDGEGGSCLGSRASWVNRLIIIQLNYYSIRATAQKQSQAGVRPAPHAPHILALGAMIC